MRKLSIILIGLLAASGGWAQTSHMGEDLHMAGYELNEANLETWDTLPSLDSGDVARVGYYVTGTRIYYWTGTAWKSVVNQLDSPTFGTMTAATAQAQTATVTGTLTAAHGDITSASFTGISTTGNAVIAGQGRFGSVYSTENTGIGKATPTAKLQVVKNNLYTDEFYPALRLDSSASSPDTTLFISTDATNHVSSISSLASTASWITRPLALQPNGGGVVIGGIARSATEVLYLPAGYGLAAGWTITCSPYDETGKKVKKFYDATTGEEVKEFKKLDKLTPRIVQYDAESYKPVLENFSDTVEIKNVTKDIVVEKVFLIGAREDGTPVYEKKNVVEEIVTGTREIVVTTKQENFASAMKKWDVMKTSPAFKPYLSFNVLELPADSPLAWDGKSWNPAAGVADHEGRLQELEEKFAALEKLVNN